MYSYIYYSGGQKRCCSYRSVSFSINNCVFDEFAAQVFFLSFHTRRQLAKPISLSLSLQALFTL